MLNDYVLEKLTATGSKQKVKEKARYRASDFRINQSDNYRSIERGLIY